MMQFIGHFMNIDCSTSAWIRREVLRFYTFERLHLRHTCCDRGFKRLRNPIGSPFEYRYILFPEFDDDGINDMNEEQEEQIEQLETILPDLEAEYDRLGVSFTDFLEGHWGDRMKEMSQRESPINCAELENMGVKIHETRSSSHWSRDDLSSSDDSDS
jgi:hypothetical protein